MEPEVDKWHKNQPCRGGAAKESVLNVNRILQVYQVQFFFEDNIPYFKTPAWKAVFQMEFLDIVWDFVKGVINLRGKVIPIVDFRLKFRMAAADQTDQTCIIVVEVGGITGTMLTGVIVDSVSEVVDIREGDIENAPSFGIEADTAFILGMAKVKDKVTTLLDIDRVLDIKQIEKVINQ
jgi:chemotaxis signal transduction protein